MQVSRSRITESFVDANLKRMSCKTKETEKETESQTEEQHHLPVGTRVHLSTVQLGAVRYGGTFLYLEAGSGISMLQCNY